MNSVTPSRTLRPLFLEPMILGVIRQISFGRLFFFLTFSCLIFSWVSTDWLVSHTLLVHLLRHRNPRPSSPLNQSVIVAILNRANKMSCNVSLAIQIVRDLYVLVLVVFFGGHTLLATFSWILYSKRPTWFYTSPPLPTDLNMLYVNGIFPDIFYSIFPISRICYCFYNILLELL